MTVTPSTMMPLGTSAPDFALSDVVSGKTVKLEDFADKKVLYVVFTCRHCPFARHATPALTRIGNDYKNQDVAIVAISSNDAANYPDDGPESLGEYAREAGFTFPLLYDESQEVAKTYTAACTPDSFVFDQERKLVYRGQIDDTRPGSKPGDGRDVRLAIDAVLENREVNTNQRPSVGCNIKWKPGNEPEYAK